MFTLNGKTYDYDAISGFKPLPAGMFVHCKDFKVIAKAYGGMLKTAITDGTVPPALLFPCLAVVKKDGPAVPCQMTASRYLQTLPMGTGTAYMAVDRLRQASVAVTKLAKARVKTAELVEDAMKAVELALRLAEPVGTPEGKSKTRKPRKPRVKPVAA